MFTFKTVSKYKTGIIFFKTIHKILALITILWLSGLTFVYVMPYYPNLLRWGTFIIWFGIAIIFKPKFFEKFLIQCWSLLVFFIYISIVSYFQADVIMYVKNTIYLIMLYSIFLYYFDNKYNRFKKILVYIIIVDWSFVALNTYFQLRKNPSLARYLSTGPETQALLLGNETYRGVGDYGYFYALVPLILLTFFIILNDLGKKWISILLLLSLSYLLISASFTISILLCAIFILALIANKLINKNIVLILVPLLIILFMLSQKYIGAIFIKLSKLKFISEDISIRFYELANFFIDTNITGTDLLSRFELYTMSINAFLNNIVTGSALLNNHGYTAGGHSTWLDLLALFGIFATFFFIFLYKAYKYFLKSLSKDFRDFYRIYWLYFVCLGFINTLFFARIFIIWLLFIPFFIQVFLDNKSKGEIK